MPTETSGLINQCCTQILIGLNIGQDSRFSNGRKKSDVSERNIGLWIILDSRKNHGNNLIIKGKRKKEKKRRKQKQCTLLKHLIHKGVHDKGQVWPWLIIISDLIQDVQISHILLWSNTLSYLSLTGSLTSLQLTELWKDFHEWWHHETKWAPRKSTSCLMKDQQDICLSRARYFNIYCQSISHYVSFRTNNCST